MLGSLLVGIVVLDLPKTNIRADHKMKLNKRLRAVIDASIIKLIIYSPND